MLPFLHSKLEKRVLITSYRLNFNGEWFHETVSEHHTALILRGPNLGGALTDSDPRKIGAFPLVSKPLTEDSNKTKKIIPGLLINPNKS